MQNELAVDAMLQINTTIDSEASKPGVRGLDTSITQVVLPLGEAPGNQGSVTRIGNLHRSQETTARLTKDRRVSK